MKMSDSIRLSPKHGVNPCISVCFFCGEDKDEIALLGKIGKDDPKAPHRAILDYEPCDKCKKEMAKGVAVIGVTTTPNNPGQPPIQQTPEATLYPTGNMVVMTPDSIRRTISDQIMAENIIAHGTTFADDEIVKHIMDKYETDTGHKPPTRISEK